ncbi:MAG: hypothetical protein CMI30_06350 [Opitutae bacterium]|nr:hypothetical protein [Opitutae bacterium]|tara:strand:- start:6826 stop:7320 length:495 start_codon:yes stop_codon:yes gene_type:complete
MGNHVNGLIALNSMPLIIAQKPDLFDLTIRQALNEPVYLGAIALLVCLLGLLVLARKLKTELIPAFQDKQGSVHVTPHALHELVRKSCEQIEEVKSRNTQIMFDRGKLTLNVRLQVNSDTVINEARARLRNHLDVVLVDNLGLKNFTGVNITIVGFNTVEVAED